MFRLGLASSKAFPLIIISFFLSCGFFIYVLFSPPIHDYFLYMEQWQIIMDGFNPWSVDNPYGPIHNLFAVFYSIHYNFPRLIFVFSFLLSAIWLTREVFQNPHIPEKVKLFIWGFLFLNPFMWSKMVICSHNDAIMACLGLFAVLFYRKNRDYLSGIFLGLSMMTKFMPIVMIPFFILQRRKIRWRFSIALFFTLAISFGISYLIWGDNFIQSFYNNEKEFKAEASLRLRINSSSILGFIQSTYTGSFLKAIILSDYVPIFLIAFSLVIFFMYHFVCNLNPIFSAMTSLWLLILFYGIWWWHYYVFLMFVTIYWCSLYYEQISNKVKHSLFIFGCWISLAASFSPWIILIQGGGINNKNWSDSIGKFLGEDNIEMILSAGVPILKYTPVVSFVLHAWVVFSLFKNMQKLQNKKQ